MVLKMLVKKRVTNRKGDCCGTVPELSRTSISATLPL